MRRKRNYFLNSKRDGFTIVELLIVIVVIAILAAITLVAFNGVTKKARESAAQSATQQAAKKIAAYAVDNNGDYPASLASIAINDDSSTTYQYRVDNSSAPHSYCVTVSVADVSFFISSEKQSPERGGCPGHGQGGEAPITNLASNPGFEGGSSSIDMWQNLVLNPSPTNTSNWSFGGQSRNLTAQDGYVKATRVDGTGNTVIRARTSGVTSSTVYTVIGTALSTTNYSAEIRLRIDDNLADSVLAGTLNLAANVPQSFHFTITSSAVAYTSSQSVTLGGGTSTADQVIGMKDVAVVPGTYDGEFFNGDVSSDPDMRPIWTGAVGASISMVKATLVPDATAVQSGTNKAVSSTRWKADGSASVRLIPVTSSNNSWVAPGGDSGGLRLGMQPGKTYTALVTVHLERAQTGLLSSSARKIIVLREGYSVIVTSDQAPNSAGSHELRVTFTVPSAATHAFIRLYNGASEGNGDVWYDNFMLVEGNYSGGYHDGGSQNWIWNGIPNVSTSTGPAQ